MKTISKIISLLAGASLLLAGCAKETGLSDEGLQNVTFAVSAMPEGTRAVADSDGAAANVNHWIMEVRDSDGDVYNRQEDDATEGETTHTFNVTIVKGQVYDVLFWADTKGTYNTDDLTDVKLLDSESAGYAANLDSRDAFSAVEAGFTTTTATSKNITLKRPFAQLNVIFTDLSKLYTTIGNATEYAKFKPEDFLAKAKVPTSFNVKTQTAGSPVATALEITAAGDYLDNYDPHAAEATLFMDYFFATASSKDIVDIDFSFVSKGVAIAHSFTAVPFQRNYRTNIKGELMTSGAKFDVTVDPAWNAPDAKHDVVNDIKSLNELLASSSVSGASNLEIETTMPNDSDSQNVNFTSNNNGQNIALNFSGDLGTGKTITLQPSGTGATGPDVLEITAPAGTNIVSNLDNTHFIINGTSYGTISGSFSLTSLIVSKGVSVSKIILTQGGLEIHGTVGEVEIPSNHGTIYVRDCEGLSQEVYDVLKDYIADGYYSVLGKTAENKWDICLGNEFEAAIGKVGYATLASAMSAVAANDVVTLLKNINLTSTINLNVDAEYSLDLNGKTITSSTDAFQVSKGTLTLIGNGTVDTDGTDIKYSFRVANSGKLVVGAENQNYDIKLNDLLKSSTETTIWSGTFSKVCCYASFGCSSSKVYINGGAFKHLDNVGFWSEECPTTFYLNGGIFNTFEAIPQSAEEYCKYVCKDGYELGDNEDTQTKTDYPYALVTAKFAKIGTTKYESLSAAFAAVQDGETIELLQDCTISSSITIDKNITLALNTNTLTAACSGYLFDINSNEAGKTFKITGTDKNNCGHIISNGTSGHNGIAAIKGQPVTFTMEFIKVHGATEEAAYVGVANNNTTSLIADQTSSKEDVINLTDCIINTTSVILGGNQTHSASSSLNISGGSYTGAKGFRFEGAANSVIDGATITVDQGIALYPYSNTELKNSFVYDNATGNTNHDAISIGGDGKVLTIANTTVNTVSKTAVAAENLGKAVINSGSFKSTLSTTGAVLRVNTSGGQMEVNGGTFDGSSAKYAVFSNTYAGSAPDDPAGIKIYGGIFTGGNTGFGDVSSDNATIDIYGGTFKTAVELKTAATQHIWLDKDNTAIFESTVNNSCGKVIYAGTFKGAVTTADKTLQGGIYYVQPAASKCVSGYEVVAQGTSPETWKVIEKQPAEVATESALKTAISDASAGDKIKLTSDVTMTSVLSIDKVITIDLNGNTLTGAQVSSPFSLTASADVTIKNGNIKDAGYTSSGGCVDVSGKATLENVNIESSCVPVRGIASTTNLTIKSGTYIAKRNVGTSSDQINNRCYCAPVCIMSGAKVNIEGGTFTGNYYSCSIFSSGGTLNISGGTFNKGIAQTEANEGGGLAYSFLNDGANSATGTITITGNPIIHGSFRGRVNNQAGHPGVLNISGGTFDSDCELFNFNSSNVHLTGYSISANGECPDKGYSKTTGNGKRWTLSKNN